MTSACGGRMRKSDHLFIVGAGFSFHSCLSLTRPFTEELLKGSDYSSTAPSRKIVEYLRKFVHATFNHLISAPARFWPPLEDIFTTVDLAANTGHHLGRYYSPAQLRVIRRALICRIIRMLRQAYNEKKNAPDKRWRNLEKLFSKIDIERGAFLSMNWDTVLKAGLSRCQSVDFIDYGCDALKASFDDDTLQIREGQGSVASKIKMHGSANWLYCDSCRDIYWVSAGDTFKVADALLNERDWKEISVAIGARYEDEDRAPLKCPQCKANALGTRLATFSYRKALDFPMFEKSWLSAERLLRQADNWIFIGYSLPAADYMFKHLLKHVQLSRRKRPKIILVSGGDQAEETKRNFHKFFGPVVSKAGGTFFDDGIDDKVLKEFVELGALVD